MSLQEYMAFMISRETENVQSAREVIDAFRALTTGEKGFITATELFAVSTSTVLAVQQNIYIYYSQNSNEFSRNHT